MAAPVIWRLLQTAISIIQVIVAIWRFVEERAAAALFVHELTHARQYQLRENVLLKGLILQSAKYMTFGKFNPYLLPVGPIRYGSLNLEQQGEFVTRTLFPRRVGYKQ